MVPLDCFSPAFFYEARWFGAKNAEITAVEIIDEAVFPREGAELILAMARVFLLQSGVPSCQDYFVPVINGACGDREILSPLYALAVNELMASGAVLAGKKGTFHFYSLNPRPWRARSIGGTSNSLLFLEQQTLIKNYRLLIPGVNRELEMYLALGKTGTGMIPELLGYAEYRGADGTVFTLILALEGVIAEGTGWQHFLKRGKHYLLTGKKRPKALSEDRAEAFNLGLATAIFHKKLAAVEDETFVPVPWDEAGAGEWMHRVLEDLAGNRLFAKGIIRQHWLHRLACLAQKLPASYPLWGKRQRCHGDFHLGQVLRTPGGFLIIDLEGEPLHEIRERKQKQSPCKDLAGMMRSFSYAAAVAAQEMAEEIDKPGGWFHFMHQLYPWQESLGHAFLEGYLWENRDNGNLPAPPLFQNLLRFFILEKALYELAYEQSRRPDWAFIPQAGIKDAVRGLLK